MGHVQSEEGQEQEEEELAERIGIVSEALLCRASLLHHLQQLV